MQLSPDLRVFITGKTQSGKSYLAKKLLLGYNNAIIYDLKGEYSQFGAVVTSLEGLKRALQDGCRKCVFQPKQGQKGYDDEFNRLCEFIFMHLKNLVFVVDEVQLIVQKMLIPPWFKSIITAGQGEQCRIGVICISQRPANVHNDIISQSSVVFAFRLNLEADAKAVSAFTGIPTEALQSLEHRFFYAYNERDIKPFCLHRPV